jgi:tRNA pseudouridine38-40 synthase
MTIPTTTWKLTLTYDGSPFSGWQVQPSQPTVQGKLAAAIEHITGETVLPQGSGRTDAGVHALGQVASFALAAPIPAANLLRALNRALPPAIRVLTAEPAPPGFHARHNALRKTYEYRIFERRILPENSTHERICSPFLAPYAWDCRWPLNLAPMQQAATRLLGTHDFTSFAATDPDLTQRTEAAASAPNPIKTIHASTLTREDGLLRYRVTGSGFLHHMVRNIVGTLVEIGRGALPAQEIPRILAARDRSAASPTAPAQGLYLVSVEYPAELTSHPSELIPDPDPLSFTPEGPPA